MSIGKDKKIIQVIIHQNTKSYIDKYAQIFNSSVSEFCKNAIEEKILKLMNMELEIENQKSYSIN